jgi:hypothetical protein
MTSNLDQKEIEYVTEWVMAPWLHDEAIEVRRVKTEKEKQHEVLSKVATEAAIAAALPTYLSLNSVRGSRYCDPIQEATRIVGWVRSDIEGKKRLYDPLFDYADKEAYNLAYSAYYKAMKGIKQ